MKRPSSGQPIPLNKILITIQKIQKSDKYFYPVRKKAPPELSNGVYSYLSASTGSNFAAFRGGKCAKNIPTAAENENARITDHRDTLTGTTGKKTGIA